jgi:hypothetical protein
LTLQKNIAIVLIDIFLFITNLPEIVTFFRYGAHIARQNVIEMELNKKHIQKMKGEAITDSTYIQKEFNGDDNKRINFRIYSNNDIWILTQIKRGEEYAVWVASKESQENIEKSLPSIKNLIGHLSVISAYAQQSPPRNVSFRDEFIRWEVRDKIAVYRRYYDNGEIWEYFYNIPRRRLYNFKKTG